MLKTKKIVSILLTVCMVMSLVSTVAFAAGENVAKVGDVEYATIQAAVDAASDGDTVYLLKSVSVSTPVVIEKSITLNGQGNCLTYTGTNRAINNDSATACNVSITNLKIVADNAQRGINFNNGGKLNIDGVIFESNKSSKATYAINLPGSSDGAVVTINNSYIVGLIALNVWGEGVKVNASATEFVSCDYSSAEDYAAIVLNDDGATAAENTVVTLTNCQVSATTETGAESSAIFNATKTGRVDYDDATVINGTVVAPVAVIEYENKNFYSFLSLQEAIDRAIKDGKPVEVINNVIEDEIVVIEGAVTINGNGYKLVSSATRAVNVKTSAEVTINDLTIEGESNCERGVNFITYPGTTNLNGVKIYGCKYAINFAASAGAAKLNVNNSDVTGYAAINFANSGSIVNITDSKIASKNVYDAPEANSYSTIVVGSDSDNIVINVSGGELIAEATGKAKQMIIGASPLAGDNLKATLDSKLVTIGDNAVIMGVLLEKKYPISVRKEYKDALIAEGFGSKASQTEGLIDVDYDKEIYTVTFVADDKNVSTVLVQEGDNVELIAVPEKEGFTGKWDSDGKNITANTTIKAVYTKIIDTKEVFTDVVKDEWYKSYVDYAYSHKLLVGVSDKEFGVDEALTRGMFVTVLARIHGIDTGADANKDAKPEFTDVKAGEYYSKAVEWAKTNKVVAGYEDGTFRANNTVSRQELCKMLVNYVEFAKVTLKDDKEAIDFADADKIGDWAKSAVTTCQKAGIVVGYELNSKTYFGPQDTATRAQGSVILAKFHSEYVK